MKAPLIQLVNSFAESFAGILDWIGFQVLDLIQMDIGIEGGFFEKTFPFMANLTGFFQMFGIALLMFIFIFQLIKNYFGPLADDAEHPISLFFSALVAGTAIVMSPTIVGAIQEQSSKFYQEMLTIPFVEGANEAALWGNGVGVIDEVMQGFDNLGIAVLTLLFIGMLGIKYLEMLAEFVERYVLLGFMYYTAPLAFSTGVSKATSNVLKSWFRMLLSGYFMMIMNILFIRGFNAAFVQFVNNCNQAAANNGDWPNVVLWFLMLYAFLRLGNRLDSHLASLGLNAAHTGGGLLKDALTSAAIMSSAVVSSKGAVAKIGSTAGAVASETGIADIIAGKTTPGGPPVDKRDGRGLPTKDTIQNYVNQPKGQSFTLAGTDVTQALGKDLKNITGLDTEQLKANKTVASAGQIQTELNDGTKITFRPTSGPNAVQPEKGEMGRLVSLNGQEYFAQAKGPGANRFLAPENPALEAKLNKQLEGKEIESWQPIKTSNDPLADNSGGYRVMDEDGNYTEYIPAGNQIVPDYMGASMENIGGVDYYVVNSGNTDIAQAGIIYPEQEQKQKYLEDFFFGGKSVPATDISYEMEFDETGQFAGYGRNYYTDGDGRNMMLAPLTAYSVNPAFEDRIVDTVIDRVGGKNILMDVTGIDRQVAVVSPREYSPNKKTLDGRDSQGSFYAQRKSSKVLASIDPLMRQLLNKNNKK